MPRDEYDLTEAFRQIENELIASIIRNLKRHRAEETEAGYNWSMWQTEQLKALEKYKAENQKKYRKQFKTINEQIKALITMFRSEGEMEQELAILEAIRDGFQGKRVSKGATAEFFKLNDRKLDALIEATVNDMKKAETAVLRMANDQYRKVIYNAQVYANTGAGTYEKAVDMATRDFLAAGLNCIEYANGSRHTISDYADMAIRTAGKRAYLQGEGTKRQEWGISTVVINKRGDNPCPKCLPFVGKVMIDDVWSGGPADGKSPVTGIKYPRISDAIAAGLYHPRCRDSHTTYFEGISTPPDGTFSKKELNEIAEKNRQEARQQYAERQEEKYGRLAEYSLDPENQKQYEAKREEWEHAGKTNENEHKNVTKILAKKGISDTMELTNADRYVLNQYVSFDFYQINDKLRNGKQLTALESQRVENLDAALKKIPYYQGNLSRSLYFGDTDLKQGFLNSVRKKDEISFPEFISTTCASELYNPDGEVQIFIQNAVRGHDITMINEMEQEVLYERNQKFRVLTVTEQDGKYWIVLEEQ